MCCHIYNVDRETESNYVRDDLAQYLSNAACDACGGSRLNEISRNVRVKDKTIAQIHPNVDWRCRRLLSRLKS